jgi:hypothetical protein
VDPSKYSQRQRKLARHNALKNERETWITRWKTITEFLLPFSGRFFVGDRNKGDKVFNSILDETGTRAHGILAAGLMAGMTSPARPWFRLAIPDKDMMEADPIKRWLDDVAGLMRDIFAQSNTYRMLHSVYEELGAFATSVNVIESNYEKVIWHTPLTAGEFCIATDDYGRVNTLTREYEMTVAQLVSKFGRQRTKSGSIDWSVFSPGVKNAWDNGHSFDQWRPVVHVIEPRDFEEREYGKRDAKNMPWASHYYELGTDSDNKCLRESGYRELPLMAPRWHTRGGDIYGHGPSMNALGSIKQLQHQQLRKGQAIDYKTRPPLALPGEMKGKEVNTLPGGTSYITGATTGKGFELFKVDLELQPLLLDIQDVRQRISESFYADLFLMISNDQRRMPATAREITERHEEKLLMLGPVLERLHDELLSPLIDVTFAKMVEAGILPPAPPELEGLDLQVQFVSVLAQAQKAVGLQSFDRLIATIGAIGQQSGDMSVWDKLDKDQLVDKYADMLAVDPDIIVADEKIAIIRQDRAKAQQAAQVAEQAPAMAGAARDLAQVPTDEQNMATDMINQFTGYAGV